MEIPANPPVVTLEPRQVLRGDFAVLRVDQPLPGEPQLHVGGLSEQPKLFLLDRQPTALIGFPAAAPLGAYPVRLTWDGGEWEGSIEVVYKEFTVDRLEVTEEQEEVYYDPRQAEQWERLYRLRSTSEPEPLWRDVFRPPLDGELRVTTYFGEIRVVNGVETGRHSGMDFGAPTGTPIYAPARGKVILAEEFIVSGRTIVIDHGLNLFTAYYHCEEIHVAPGDWVEAGQRIGLVGSTGFSTGPHLHWTATVGNTPVDPWPLTQGRVADLFTRSKE
ncbi:hypothetical protein J2Z79_002203 [Symbiobacterium terraclitae]|uniref:M23ase beta-sheet core domain-containing protein n=1 Tax=Symbiobacterium terraclitae TaxID=557451 RepID=A0ABS4JTD3_9FIRM|nr:hypothetical protein [Symbiobacterium terraclitae]